MHACSMHVACSIYVQANELTLLMRVCPAYNSEREESTSAITHLLIFHENKNSVKKAQVEVECNVESR